MPRLTFVHAGLITGLLALTAPEARAAAADYRFEVVEAKPAGAAKTDVAVRLVHLPDNKPVSGAIIIQAKTDMGPSGMGDMTGTVTPQPPGTEGVYRFQTENGMPGRSASGRCRRSIASMRRCFRSGRRPPIRPWRPLQPRSRRRIAPRRSPGRAGIRISRSVPARSTAPGLSVTKAAELLQTQNKIIKSFPEVATVYGKAGRAATATDPAPTEMMASSR